MVRKLSIRETFGGKHEAVSRKRSTRSSGNKANSVGKFLDTQIERGKIDEKQVTVVYDKNNNIMWLGKAGFYPLFMSNIEYRSSGYDADHPHELWINARSYTTPFEESFKRSKTKSKMVIEKLDWQVVHDADDDDGNPTMWSAKIDSSEYGKYMWIEKSYENGYDIVVNPDGDDYVVLKSSKSLGWAKKAANDIVKHLNCESLYGTIKESGMYDYFDVPGYDYFDAPDGSFNIYDDIPDEPFTEEDEFNYYVDYIYDHAKTPDDARRFLRSEGKSEDYIDRVIAAVDAIYG